MANWFAFGQDCDSAWGRFARGAECAYERRQTDVYNTFRDRDNELFNRSLAERELLYQQFMEIGRGLIIFILIAAFIVYFFRD